MPQPAHTSTLYEALQSLPPGLTGEIIQGQLHTQPRPSGRHALAESNLAIDLGSRYSRGHGGPGGWWILVEPEIHFVRDQEVLVPDLAGWRRNRMAAPPEDQRFEVVPDWVCEILSPASSSKDREVKMPTYASYGVAFAWLVDPKAQILEAYALQQGEWRPLQAFGPQETVRAPPFEEAPIRVADLWS